MDKNMSELVGKKVKARQDYTCQCCMGIIHKGQYYDYSDGWSAMFWTDEGYKTRKYFQFRVHLTEDCEGSDYIPETTSCILDF